MEPHLHKKATSQIVAIDIAKDSLQVLIENKNQNIPYNDSALKKLIEKISKLSDPLVVFEATGGYEKPLMRLLHKKKIALALLNPALVRAFALSEGIKAKTDPIDAQMLLRFAQEKKIRATPPPNPIEERIAALMDRRDQLTEQKAREKNRLQKSHPSIAKDIQRMLRFIEKELVKIEAQIEQLIDEDQGLKQQAQIMNSIKGVGKVTTWSVIAYLREINSLNRNQVVALVGIAPYNRDSGKRSAKRSIYAGRAKVRKALYMAAQTAAQHNPVIKDYVQGLIARGKPYKCAMVAAMRKLLIHIQSLLKNTQFTLDS